MRKPLHICCLSAATLQRLGKWDDIVAGMPDEMSVHVRTLNAEGKIDFILIGIKQLITNWIEIYMIVSGSFATQYIVQEKWKKLITMSLVTQPCVGVL